MTRAEERTVQHTPGKPSWMCTQCGEDWPCIPARIGLDAEYGDDRVGLAVQMVVQLGRAAGDLVGATPTDLHYRFIAWTR